MNGDNTTSINNLPTDPTIGGSINLTVNEQGSNDANKQSNQQSVSLDQYTISQIVNGLQQASLAGATTLPSRDIPLNQEQLTNDIQSQPNFVPTPENRDYISDEIDDIHAYYSQEHRTNTLDSLYDEIQTPLLLSVLYFLFQLPVFKKTLFTYLPFLCHNDGNYNFNGLVFTCALFSVIYYTLSKSVKQFSKF